LIIGYRKGEEEEGGGRPWLGAEIDFQFGRKKE
jgi:hypothetical protein